MALLFRRGVMRCVLAMALLGSAVHPLAAQAADEAKALTGFDTPFQVSYTILGWKDQIQATDGRLVLRKAPAAGGAGIQAQSDLSASADCTPVLKLKTTASNTAKSIQIKFSDADGRTGSFRYALPQPSDGFVSVLPRGSVALSTPNLLENAKDTQNPGKLDLGRIVQYQLLGDWVKNTVLDLEIDAIVFVSPDAQITTDRAAYAKEAADEAAAKAKKDADEKAAQAKARADRIRAYSHRTSNSPEIVHVSMVAPDILSLTIEAQRVIPQSVTKYVPQDGDDKKEELRPDGTVKYARLNRDGKPIGRLMGKNLDWFVTPERIEGDPLLEFMCDDAANYTIQSNDDPAFAQPITPASVYRKSVPINTRLPGGAHPTRHRVYLKLPAKLDAGKTYSINVDKLNVKNAEQKFVATLDNVRSESVHVNQIGYRPDDAAKRAFLSVWLGTGGAYTFPDGLNFSVLEDKTGKAVFNGKVERILEIDGKEALWIKPPKNYNNTAVYRMDFSAFNTPGVYRIYVEGVGCSYAFPIGDDVWRNAFLVQMKGVYNQRSGVELGAPYTDFKRPRDFHPDDGVVAIRSTYDAMATGMNSYGQMAKQATGEVVPNAWGGYHDAGDWNPRRVTHMRMTLAQLELCELFPTYFNTLKLNIPPTDGVPDMITEALFEIDCFRRVQQEDGGIPFGLETEGDPLAGEMSWLTTQKLYVLAPTIRDSWLYAAVAGRAAKLLKPIKPDMAKIYEQSAIRAFAWAEADFARDPRPDGKSMWEAKDARNLSALVLYDLTGEQSYHQIFLKTTALTTPGTDIYAFGQTIQSDAAFLYARLEDARTDLKIKANARAATIDLAERSLKYAAGNAFNLTNRERGRPMFAGFFSTSGGPDLVRAHFLTGKPEYLKGAVVSCQFQSGCNPNNIVYTTGLGANPIKVPLEVDARASGQPAPIGLTVFGNTDYFNHPNSFWDINLQFVNKPDILWPNAYEWPLTEAYFEAWMLVSANEYVIETWAPNVLVWGYLAARQ